MLTADPTLPVDALECAEELADVLNNALGDLDGRDLAAFDKEAGRLLKAFRAELGVNHERHKTHETFF